MSSAAEQACANPVCPGTGSRVPYRRLSPGDSDAMRLAQAFLLERKLETFELYLCNSCYCSCKQMITVGNKTPGTDIMSETDRRNLFRAETAFALAPGLTVSAMEAIVQALRVAAGKPIVEADSEDERALESACPAFGALLEGEAHTCLSQLVLICRAPKKASRSRWATHLAGIQCLLLEVAPVLVPKVLAHVSGGKSGPAPSATPASAATHEHTGSGTPAATPAPPGSGPSATAPARYLDALVARVVERARVVRRSVIAKRGQPSATPPLPSEPPLMEGRKWLSFASIHIAYKYASKPPSPTVPEMPGYLTATQHFYYCYHDG